MHVRHAPALLDQSSAGSAIMSLIIVNFPHHVIHKVYGSFSETVYHLG